MLFEDEPGEFLNKGEVIYQQGQEADQLVIVQAGKVVLTRTSDHKQKHNKLILDIVKPGGYIGWETIERSPYFSTATAFTDSEITRITGERLKNLLSCDTWVIDALLAGLSARLRDREEFRYLDVWDNDNGRRSTAAALIEFADGVKIKGVTQTDLAEFAGNIREEVSKNTCNFRATGILEWGNKGGRILDLEKLKLIRAGLL